MRRLSFKFSSCIAFTKLVVLGMSIDVLYVHSILDKLDESNHSKTIAADIDYPPFVLVLKIVQ